jgi:hypothetical protein
VPTARRDARNVGAIELTMVGCCCWIDNVGLGYFYEAERMASGYRLLHSIIAATNGDGVMMVICITIYRVILPTELSASHLITITHLHLSRSSLLSSSKTVILTFLPGEAGKSEHNLGVWGSKSTK